MAKKFEGKELRETFQTPYEQYRRYNGAAFTVERRVDPETYDAAEVGPMYQVWLDADEDGVNIQAWPEEIFTGN